MGETTGISWCDSTLNLQMGCDGCELWTKKARVCYAGILVEKYGGRKGWPEHFGKPVIFPERIDLIQKCSDLRGMERPDKPWIPASMPRLIFLDDMGDTFTKSLPLNWLLPYIPALEKSPHIFQILTKRPKRMKSFFDFLGYVPDNFWLGTSITDQPTSNARLEWLLKIKARTLFVSFEPMLEPVIFAPWNRDNVSPADPRISWVILGGMSGPNFKEMSMTGLKHAIGQCKDAGIPVFVKQDSGPYPGQQGRIPDELWLHEFPQVETNIPQDQPSLFETE